MVVTMSLMMRYVTILFFRRMGFGVSFFSLFFFPFFSHPLIVVLFLLFLYGFPLIESVVYTRPHRKLHQVLVLILIHHSL